MMTATKNIVILGGGYAGMMAALRLAGKTKRLNTNITLVNGLEHFVERPRLHREIATILDKSESACRQLFRRAKRHITANRPRFEATPEQHERLLHSFINVIQLGEVEAFLQLLAEEVTFVPDGGGERGAAIRVLQGPEAVAAFILGVYRMNAEGLQYNLAMLNGQQAILARTTDGRPFFVVFIYSKNGIIHLIHVIAGRKLSTIVT